MNLPYTVQQLSDKLNPIFKKYQVKKAVLFGSYAKNCPSSVSDVDIYVDSGLIGMRFFGLLEDICNVVECPVDLIDSVDVIPGSRIDKEIKNTGVLLYEC